ncbi:MAG: wax ester/triacylglycerol synthase family O-acyltransferase [Woeseiaceae bacterium]|nr:wax ester/triacylglycerol synthase family O-acyltransferase [Woeseiaceae bacterium]
MDRLSLLESGFVYLETPETPMHVAGLNLFKLPKGVNQQAFLAGIADVYRSTTELRKPFAHRVSRGRLGRLGPLCWAEDPGLDLDYHVRQAALPKPGRYRELFALVSQLHSTLLDQSRPLWETYLIEGLKNREFAIYTKLHHAAVDGVGGVRITEAGCSPDPDATADLSPLSIEAHERFKKAHRRPRADELDPSESELRAIADFVKAQFDTSVHALGLVKSYAATWLGLGNGLAVPWRHVPHTMINAKVSSSRRFVAQSWSIDRVRAVGKAADVTLNDVVLAMCSGALRRYLAEQGELPEHSLRSLVPVSVRSEDDFDSPVAVSYIVADLGTRHANPLDRLEAIVESTRAGKKMLADLSPREAGLYASLVQTPLFVASMMGVADRFPPVSTVISNIPGPRETLYFNGARLLGVYPVSAVFHGFALNITFVSYHDKLDFGIVACRQTVPHVQRLIDYLEQSLAELETAVRQ